MCTECSGMPTLEERNPRCVLQNLYSGEVGRSFGAGEYRNCSRRISHDVFGRLYRTWWEINMVKSSLGSNCLNSHSSGFFIHGKEITLQIWFICCEN